MYSVLFFRIPFHVLGTAEATVARQKPSRITVSIGHLQASTAPPPLANTGQTNSHEGLGHCYVYLLQLTSRPLRADHAEACPLAPRSLLWGRGLHTAEEWTKSCVAIADSNSSPIPQHTPVSPERRPSQAPSKRGKKSSAGLAPHPPKLVQPPVFSKGFQF